MDKNIMVFDFQSRPRLNRPPLTSRAKLAALTSSRGHKTRFQPHNIFDTHSSNASCDTTLDESLSMCSREAYSLTNLNISHYSEMMADNLEARSIDCLDSTERRENGPEEASYTLLNPNSNQKKKLLTDETKYKTEMCKKWLETNQCPYGKKCKFAHGRQELNEKLLNNRSTYRSKKCNSFHTTMTCPYGIRCLFAHEQRQLDELLTASPYGRFIVCPDLLENSQIPCRKRLPVFSTMKSAVPSTITPHQRNKSQSDKGTFAVDPSKCLYNWGDYEDFQGISSAFKEF